MSILIQGKMPTNGEVIVIEPNGQAILYAGDYVVFIDDPRRVYKTIYKTIKLPPHGDLIDRSKIGLTDFEIVMCHGDFKQGLKRLSEKIENAPTIIPAEEE